MGRADELEALADLRGANLSGANLRDADPNGAHRLAKRHWHQSGAVTFLPDQIARMSWPEREFLNAIAAKQYGPRNGAK